ncbi:TAXI family TRAP transporter solute-binding subunit [Sporomusa sp.]|uniref:TAXI family TRAP transporter solute-binding subunit n=1 Tax=Sporomusa sp. TaxID=2078658 RepID=UPI002C190C45|nr:TAXI family TRAP transporter solute-binding subunit [Sporomusa sp.]HWR43622.1 TAXI family TRAP transporter solute-binding subunit [Sporomusa sp.]
MKKVLAVLLVCIMVTASLVGCGGNRAASQKPTQMILATGGTAGTYHPFGSAMARIFNSKVQNVNVTAQLTGASIENLRLVNKKEAELAIVQSDMLDYAYNGKESFREKLPNLTGIAVLYPEVIQLVVRPDSGINTIADLKGKKVGVGAPGSGTEANFRQLIDVFGLDYQVLTPQYLSFAESADQFKGKRLDAFLVTAGIPNSAIQDVSSQQNIIILSLADDKITRLTQKYPFLASFTIPANTYKDQSEVIKTVAVSATLIVGPQVPEDVVYNITKALFENQAELAQAHAKGIELTLETAVKGMPVPFHPGAARYFKEKGVLK